MPLPPTYHWWVLERSQWCSHYPPAWSPHLFLWAVGDWRDWFSSKVQLISESSGTLYFLWSGPLRARYSLLVSPFVLLASSVFCWLCLCHSRALSPQWVLCLNRLKCPDIAVVVWKSTAALDIIKLNAKNENLEFSVTQLTFAALNTCRSNQAWQSKCRHKSTCTKSCYNTLFQWFPKVSALEPSKMT